MPCSNSHEHKAIEAPLYTCISPTLTIQDPIYPILETQEINHPCKSTTAVSQPYTQAPRSRMKIWEANVSVGGFDVRL